MTAAKKKMRRRLSVVDLIIKQTTTVRQMFEDSVRQANEKFSGAFGMLHEIKNELRMIREATRNAAGPALEQFKPAQKVTAWLVADPDPSRAPLYVGKGETIREPNELAAALYELTQRVHTLGQTGRTAVLTFDSDRGALELHSRERVQ